METSQATESAPRDTGGLANQIRAFLAGCAAYATARLRLAQEESREASKQAVKIVSLLVGCLLAAAMGWFFLCLAGAFFLARAIGGDQAWLWVTLAIGLLHILAALAIGLLLRARAYMPLFPLTTEEFRKDQAWLEQQTKTN